MAAQLKVFRLGHLFADLWHAGRCVNSALPGAQVMVGSG